jgi:hypothetical protein
MGKPQIPIEVDEETGVWSTDGLPMLYMPRHFFINNHLAVEDALGRDRYAAQLYDAGFRSAWTWCEHESKRHGLAGIAVFHHYMKRISQRGWGQFDGAGIDPETCRGEVILRNSCLVLQEEDNPRPGPRCYLFSGWLPGALSWFRGETIDGTRLACEETRCAADGHEHCVFAVR